MTADTRADAVERLHHLIASGETTTAEELDEVWSQLATVRVSEILGAWRGGELPTGHPMDGQLETVGWYGKTFASPTEVAPLVCRDADGGLYSNTELGHGEASLWHVEFRGELTASMVYDGQPVIDHFKRVDATTLMGIMNGKSSLVRDSHYYFYLQLDTERDGTTA